MYEYMDMDVGPEGETHISCGSYRAKVLEHWYQTIV